ncbi:hypothetical protein E3J95_06690 [Candidatus Aerophobetes bacterium]|uniref:Thioredoxin domain-containing protein n=1 Tax=Aerophobetes bacterium TaxID=2030807 RepID=A0A523QG36_UNCAE|nr:MAG: hypothetical protein E3J95_06690 [Candidatus Aerophobetes bacterium]
MNMNKQTLRSVAVLVIIAAVVLGSILINKVRQSRISNEPRVTAPAPQQKTQEETSLPEMGEDMAETETKSVPSEAKKIVILATVNGRVITSEELDRELESLLPQYRGTFEENKEEFLNQLITMEILLQEAERQGLENEKELQEEIAKNRERRKNILIEELIDRITTNVKVSQEEVRALYKEVKAEIPGKSFQEVKAQLKSYLIQQKRQKKLGEKIEELQGVAKITRNQEWLKARRLGAMDNPLDRALRKSRPVVADFGRGICIPCKEMKPILEELAAEYEGKAAILIIEIDEYRALARRYRIRLIPTQIFFNAEGKEVYRHEGFMRKEALKQKLEQIGVE